MRSGFTKKQPSILQTDRRRQIEMAVLELEAGATAEDIKMQFRILCKRGHPDAPNVGHRAAPYHGLQEMRAAKDWLIKDLEGIHG